MGDFNTAYWVVVELLLFHGASIGECNQSGSSLLHRAIISQQPFIVQQLLRKGVSLTCLGRTPLVTYLQNGGKWIDVVINAFTTSVTIICGEHFNSSVLHLLSYRSPTVPDDNFFTSKTCKFYNPAACKVKNGPLVEAIERHSRKREIVNYCFDAEGFTPLHRAAQGGNMVATRYLLANGANDCILSPRGHDALTQAVLHAGRDVFWGLYEGLSFYKRILGITEGSEDVAIELLRHAMKSRRYQVKCNSSKQELTLYHLAASRGLVEFIDVLLGETESQQLDVDCLNKDGITPIYLAKIFDCLPAGDYILGNA